jgi:imidazolonepropionase-like amidohydrolase
MRRILARALFFIAFPCSAAFAGQANLILRGGTILTEDPRREVVEAVAIAGDQIRGVGSNQEIERLAGPRTRVVDLGGRTVVPGLVDAHVHLLLAQQIVDARSLKEYEETVLPRTLTGFLQHGITTVRSPGDPWPDIASVRDRLERGALIGPRLVIAGPALTAPAGHPIPTICHDNRFCREQAVRELSDEEQVRRVVRELTEGRGVDQIKVVVDHAQSPTPSSALLAALLDESHRRGRRVIAHASGGTKTTDLLGSGFDELVHTPWVTGMDDSSLASALVGRKLRVTTTVSNFEAFKGPAGAEFFVFGSTYNPGIRQTLERTLKTVRSLADAGVPLVVGTDWYDAPLPIEDARARPGARTLHELDLLRRAGLSTSAILSAATRNAAEAIGMIDRVGTIAEGKLADLVILEGNPLQDLGVLQRPVAVIQGGRVVYGSLPER